MSICLQCKKPFTKSGRNQKYCGSVKQKIGCSHGINVFQKTYYKTGQRRPRFGEGYNYRKILYEQRGKKCESCGITHEKQSFFDIDHIIPRRVLKVMTSRTIRKSEYKNLKILCPNCHREKTIVDNKW